MKYKHMKFLSEIILKIGLLWLLLTVFVRNFVSIDNAIFNMDDFLYKGIWSSGLLDNANLNNFVSQNFIKLILLVSVFIINHYFTLFFIGDVLDHGKEIILCHSKQRKTFLWQLIRLSMPVYVFDWVINMTVLFAFYMINENSIKNHEMITVFFLIVGHYCLVVALCFIVILLLLRNSLFMFCILFILIMVQNMLFSLEAIIILIICISISFSRLGNYLRGDEV